MPVPSTTSIRVRYAETDQMGVAYHANYLVWCEVGRVEMLRQLGFDYKQMELADDCHLPVVEAKCRYKFPARYDEEVTVEVLVTALRSSLIRFNYRLLRAAVGENVQLLAEAETTHVVVDSEMKRRTLPDKYATAIRASMRNEGI